MTSAHLLSILLASAFMSLVGLAVCRLQEFLNIRHQQRLTFLKTNLVFSWFVPAATAALIYSRAGDAVGTLLSGPSHSNNETLASGLHKPHFPFTIQDSSLSRVILAAYIVGLGFFLFKYFLMYWNLTRTLKAAKPLRWNGQDVKTCEIAASPFSFGFLSPQVYIPTVFLNAHDQRTMDVIVAHEQTHIDHRDPQWKLLSLLTQVFLFFTPATYSLHRRLEREMEIQCDSITMKKTSTSFVDYGRILIEAATFLQRLKPNPMLAYMSDTNLKERIQAMKIPTVHRPVLSCFFASFTILIGLGAVGSISGLSKKNENFLVTLKLLSHGKTISSPRLVVLPEMPATMEMKAENPSTLLNMMLIANDSLDSREPSAIELKMEVEYKTEGSIFHTRPHLLVLPGEESTVLIKSTSGEELEMRVIATRR